MRTILLFIGAATLVMAVSSLAACAVSWFIYQVNHTDNQDGETQ